MWVGMHGRIQQHCFFQVIKILRQILKILLFAPHTSNPTHPTPSKMSDLAYYEFMHRHLSVRERELRAIKDEYAFLQSCGGVSMEDMAFFRASVLRHTLPTTTGVSIKQEKPESPESPLVSLKSMLLDIITRDQAENINKICRHVRPLLEREGIRTFCRHHATHVRTADQPRVAELLLREGVV